MLQQALSQLSEKEQLILSMYYQHEMNLKEIALVLGLTEARICQLNKQIAQKGKFVILSIRIKVKKSCKKY